MIHVGHYAQPPLLLILLILLLQHVTDYGLAAAAAAAAAVAECKSGRIMLDTILLPLSGASLEHGRR
jgi:hypothetical protein